MIIQEKKKKSLKQILDLDNIYINNRLFNSIFKQNVLFLNEIHINEL